MLRLGATSLHYSTQDDRCNPTEFITVWCRLLLDQKADPNMRDEQGRPLLWLATYTQKEGVLDLLLQSGVSVSLVHLALTAVQGPTHVPKMWARRRTAFK